MNPLLWWLFIFGVQMCYACVHIFLWNFPEVPQDLDEQFAAHQDTKMNN